MPERFCLSEPSAPADLNPPFRRVSLPEAIFLVKLPSKAAVPAPLSAVVTSLTFFQLRFDSLIMDHFCGT